MENPKVIKIEDYTYDLPDERIARYPLEHRDASKLLIYKQGEISHKSFSSIHGMLPENSLLVWNDSRVLNARLIFHKDTGARIEIFCLSPADTDDYSQVLLSKGKCRWKCIIGNLKKWKTGKLSTELKIDKTKFRLQAELIQRGEKTNEVEFTWNEEGINFGSIMEHSGLTPVPPYLNRESEAIDRHRYQTIYSQAEGSVAAPTAGLHFSDKSLHAIEAKNIHTEHITLHVGTGTFQPVKSNTIGDHPMHTEYFYASRNLIEALEKYQGRVTAVGTTSMRGLESLLQAGINAMEGKTSLQETQNISQWEAYDRPENISLSEILHFMLKEMERLGIEEIKGKTSIMIAPGFPFLIPDRLITNFHQPGSTLLLLIAAYIGEDWKKVYRYALSNDFRFLSYGDASLLIPGNK
ncbi:MAG: S-adenosylmethionine:tRNA ribosyltransferase-isomerase [Bacteroidales bacterium]